MLTYIFDEAEKEVEKKVEKKVEKRVEKRVEKKVEKKADERYGKLIKILVAENALDKLVHAADDDSYRKQLYKEYGIVVDEDVATT